MSVRQTHTYAVLEVSAAAFEEIKAKLLAADYRHAFSQDGKTIDMSGIGLEAEEVTRGVLYARDRQGRVIEESMPDGTCRRLTDDEIASL